jgi:SAM-dependent methyltransferase
MEMTERQAGMDYTTIFSGRASRYRDAQQAWPHIRRAELECFVRLLDLKPGEHFLDAPAGNGVVSRYLAPDCHYQALDPAPGFAEDCRALGLQTTCASLRSSGLPAAGFNVVGSLTGVHHEVQREEVYAEWFRLLRPGGRLLVMDVAEGSAVGAFLNGFVHRWNNQGHIGFFLESSDEQALQALGFQQVRRIDCEYDWLADDEAQMLAFMQELFGLDLQPDAGLMAAELAATLDAGQVQQGYRVPWGLRALSAYKPLTPESSLKKARA